MQKYGYLFEYYKQNLSVLGTFENYIRFHMVK